MCLCFVMASSSGNSSGTTTTTTATITSSKRSNPLQNSNSSSEEDLQQLMYEKKRKRMQSNRESARRSRMRKQKHLDDLMAQVALLRSDNSQILNTVQVTTQHYLNVEAENSVLRAQLTELNNRLDSLNEILSYMNSSPSRRSGDGAGGIGAGVLAPAAVDMMLGVDGCMGNHWNLGYVNQPIVASADYFGGY